MRAIEKIKRTVIPWETSRHSFEFAAFTLDRLATYMENVEPDKFCKAYVVAFLRETARLFAEDSHSTGTEESCRQPLRPCSERGVICLESYRRHGAGKRMTAVQATADRRA